MGTTVFNILSVNAGSSSVKLSLHAYHPDSQDANLIDSKNFEVKSGEDAGNKVADWLEVAGRDHSIDAIGHRVVHGGPKHTQAALISQQLLDDLREFINFDPEHLPFEISLIEEIGGLFPGVYQIACFDTAFFSDLPVRASTIAMPRKYQSSGLRRYGFHGLSYEYLRQEFKKNAGEAAANGRVIYAHLGSGASLAATKDGLPVDTTMCLTPASGIVMSSRSGDIDPGLALYFHKEHGLDHDQFNQMVNFESGLLGVSELSGSMLTLLQNESTNHQAAEAIELFVYQARKYIGALSAALGGLDSLIFSGGIGEKSAIIRSRICQDLGYLGIDIDQSLNERNAELISSKDSAAGVHVIPANEAAIIVRQVFEVVKPLNEIGG